LVDLALPIGVLSVYRCSLVDLALPIELFIYIQLGLFQLVRSISQPNVQAPGLACNTSQLFPRVTYFFRVSIPRVTYLRSSSFN
jgi:hypothetical protein